MKNTQTLIGYAWLILLHYVERSRGQYDAPSDVVIVFSQTSHHALTHMTWGSAVLAAWDNGGMGYWSARLLSELKLFIIVSTLSRDPLSLMGHGTAAPCTCLCHPYTLSTIDPHITRPWSLETHSLWQYTSCAVNTEICFSLGSPCWWISPLSF